MDEQDLDRLIRRRNRISDDLQIMEMADGYHHMKASRRYQQYLALEIRIRQARKELEARRQKLNKSPPHSPLPFAVDCNDSFLVTADHDGASVAVTETADRSDEECAANTEFIARACNSHYELLEALDALIARVTERGMEFDPAAARASAAIARARGKI